MISFYDWVGPDQEGGQGSSTKERAKVVQDYASQKDPQIQATICKKIQDAVDISDVFNKIAIHSGRSSGKTLAFAVHRIARYCRLRKQDSGSTRRAPRWAALLVQIHGVLAELDAQALTDVIWSLAVLHHRDQRLLAGLCHQAFGRLEEFAPANLAMTSWSFATLQYRDDMVVKRLNRQILGRLGEFEAQSLANVAWALATMRFKDDVLMHHISCEALRKINDFSAQHVANTAWAFATLGRRAELLFAGLESVAIVQLQDPAVDFVPLDLALCAWSFAWLEHAHADSGLLHHIVPVALRRLNEFSSQQLANMLWGFDHANYKDSDFYTEIISWICARPAAFWAKSAGEELVSIITALRPYASGTSSWSAFEAFFIDNTLRPMADFLSKVNSHDGYAEGLRRLRTYHAGALYTSWLLKDLGIEYLGDGDSTRTREKVNHLLDFYYVAPEPKWRPDGYDDDDVEANRAEIPGLLELLEVKRRVQPSSHFIALHLSSELRVEPWGPEDDAEMAAASVPTATASSSRGGGLTIDGCSPEPDDGQHTGAFAPEPDDGPRTRAFADEGEDEIWERPAPESSPPPKAGPPHVVRMWRAVPAKPARRAGLNFIRGEKLEDKDLSGDEEGVLKAATLRDYRRKHHAEVISLTQVAEVIDAMEAKWCSQSSPSPEPKRVTGWVELFVPHFPCASCTGAAVQFGLRYPNIKLSVGHDDWRHWCRRLRAGWDPNDKRQHQLSVNARQLRELGRDTSNSIPDSYRAALKSSLGRSGIGESRPGAAIPDTYRRSSSGAATADSPLSTPGGQRVLASERAAFAVAQPAPSPAPPAEPATPAVVRQSFY